MFNCNLLEKIANIINMNFLNKKNSPSVKNRAEFKDSVVGSVQQANNINNIESSQNDISDLERKILYKLYKKYKEKGQYPKLDIKILHSEINISDGDYVGTANDSKFFEVTGNDYIMKEVGIRFMDNFVRNNKPDVNISHLSVSGSRRGQSVDFRLINNGVVSAIDIKCFILADGVRKVNIGNVKRINPNEELKKSINYKYSDTVFSRRLLENLKIVFEYKNKDDFDFYSEQSLSQTKRDDLNYNIST